MTTQNANKAALYSAIIFPGAGLWWLKLYARACIFIVPACVALWYIAKNLYGAVAPIYANMQRLAEEGLIGPTEIMGMYPKLSEAMHKSLAAQQSQLTTVEVILVACWVCSIVSSYFAGKKLDMEIAKRNTPAN